MNTLKQQTAQIPSIRCVALDGQQENGVKRKILGKQKMNKQNFPKLAAINAWRKAQGLEPLQSNGKTAKARANGSHAAQMGNAAARAQFCRDLKSNRQNVKRK